VLLLLLLLPLHAGTGDTLHLPRRVAEATMLVYLETLTPAQLALLESIALPDCVRAAIHQEPNSITQVNGHCSNALHAAALQAHQCTCV
jgi:hypothetical protein